MTPVTTRTVDTVVVGAGSSGAVVAARMTEDSAREVLLVEAGPDYPPGSELPRDLVDGTRNSLLAHDWGFRHRPNARQMVMPLPRGRVVGGSSAVNTCIALRGVPTDYDEWAARGLPEWSWARCLPAFKTLEHDLDFANEWHGSEGPLPLRRHPPGELVPWQRAFLEACALAGHPRCEDHNHPRAKGFGPHAMNKVAGRRMSAAECYLTPAVRARPGFSLMDRALVRRVLVRNGRVTVLEVEREGGRVETLGARRVVLCAGAIATPGVLLRSGIGPRDAVARLGVELVREVPGVGEQLLDHPGCAVFLWPRKGLEARTDHPLIQTALRYRSPNSEHENDVQIQAGSTVHLPRVSLPLVSVMCQVGKPRGRGTIRYASPDPRARPEIHSGLLDHPDDRALAVSALLHAFELVRSAPMRELATPFWPPPWAFRTRDALDGWIRVVTDSGYHPCGTVPMGTSVDERGRVPGVEGLVVADASVMPTIPTANTNLPTLMIGERFGAWLRDGEI